MPAAPSALIEALVNAPSTEVSRRCDIYESDGVTPWMLNAPVTGGSVSIDHTRAERRTLDITFDNADGALTHRVDGFWYDKVLKVFRGVRSSTYGDWETQIGEFVIDGIEAPHFPLETSVTARDYTARLLADKLNVSTTFVEGTAIETVIRALAINGGISPSKITVPLTGRTLGRDFAFDRGTERWTAMTEIASAYNYEIFFDAYGYLVMRPHQDPLTAPLSHTFQTGVEGNLTGYSRKTSPSRIYNVIVVTGTANDQMPVSAIARNENPNSPTSIPRLGYQRTYFYESSFIATEEQAQEVANSYLATRSLEQYEVSVDSIVAPWLDAGEVVRFLAPDAAPGDPDLFLLSNLTLPLDLSPMSGTARRVTIV